MTTKRFFNWQDWDFSSQFEDIVKRELDRISKGINYYVGAGAGVFPLLNITENKDAYKVYAEIPGLKSSDLDISVTGNSLIISGERKIAFEQDKDVRYHRKERDSGRFSRSVTLPTDIDTAKVEANLENGVLIITLPKAETAKPKQITIKC